MSAESGTTKGVFPAMKLKLVIDRYLQVNYPNIPTPCKNIATLIKLFQWNYGSSSDTNACFVRK